MSRCSARLGRASRYRCSFPRRAAEAFTSEQNVRRYLRTHRICSPPDYRQLAARGLSPRKIHSIVGCSLRPGTSPQALRIPPHGGHPALRRTASSGFRSVLAVSSFRRLHTFHFLRPARLRTLLLGYGAPHLSARGTSTLLINALLSAHCRGRDDHR
jgi:hypothetical protein